MGSIAEIEIKSWDRKLDNREQVEVLRKYSLVTITLDKGDDPECVTLDYWCKRVVIDLDYLELIGGSEKWTLVRTLPIQAKSNETEVEKILAALNQRDTTLLNTRLHVSVPSIGLLCMDSVMLLSDCCTDSLQEHLNEGWRIIAICVKGMREPT